MPTVCFSKKVYIITHLILYHRVDKATNHDEGMVSVLLSDHREPITTGDDLCMPFQVGDEVKCEIDWNRRYDFMQQHTSQVLCCVVLC